METKFSGKLHNFLGTISDLKAMGKKSVDWDLNDWKWDADLLLAAPLASVSLDGKSRQLFTVGPNAHLNNGASNSFSSGSNGMLLESEREKRDLEKRRRAVEVENELVNEDSGSLNLKLGAQVCSVIEMEEDTWEGKSGKKIKVSGAPASRAVCQVEDCKADLSNSKDYHRRHKVCEVHSKATRALVGSVMQRFCQQCSRFHILEEFDEGKRSCRRRLAGHNKRRRKTHPENGVNAKTLNDEQGTSYLIMSLLRLLANIHSSSSDQSKDQDLLSHLLKSLANLAGTNDEKSSAKLLPVSQELQCVGTSLEIAEKGEPTRFHGQTVAIAASDIMQYTTLPNNAECGILPYASASENPLPFMTKSNHVIKEKDSETAIGGRKLNNFDLNCIYDDSEDCVEDLQCNSENLRTLLPAGPVWLCKDFQRSSPPENSGNSGSTSNQSPSTSSGEEQSRTDRIVFKLFGKDPSDFPHLLRKQILDWLSNSPTDIESHIRPGCVILAIYLRMDNSMWEELCCNLASSLRRLIDSSTDSFWRTGWMCVRVQHHAAFVFDGQVVLDVPLPLKYHQSCRVSSIKPIAVSVSVSGGFQFLVKGLNLTSSSSRFLCALDGKCLALENCDELNKADSSTDPEVIQALSFSCAIPNNVGRGFIEVEDQCLSSSFHPFIVAEKDVCDEICSLESIIEVPYGDTQKLIARDQAFDFINEMGWILRKSSLKCRLSETGAKVDLFPFKRFRWLMEFSIDHDWCAVVNKLLNILFSGAVDSGQHTSIQLALLDIGLLHHAIRRNCRPMVEFLLEYDPSASLIKAEFQQNKYVFMPDNVGPGGLTPLHIAACLDGRDNVLDALTDDPGSAGIVAWKNAKDCTGLTPHDYACFRGHYSYIHLVQRKQNKKSGESRHIVMDIPDSPKIGAKQKTGNTSKFSRFGFAFDTEQKAERGSRCSECERQLGCSTSASLTSPSVRIYKPAMLSMVAIAAVCVCAALLFKSSPEVLYSFRPFRWELLRYGSE